MTREQAIALLRRLWADGLVELFGLHPDPTWYDPPEFTITAVIEAYDTGAHDMAPDVVSDRLSIIKGADPNA